MKNMYQVTIYGRTLESRDLKLLLSRAVSEKRSLDHRIRRCARSRLTEAAEVFACPNRAQTYSQTAFR